MPFKVNQFIYRHASRGVCPLLDEEHSDQSLVRELDTTPTILYISFDKLSINPHSQQTLVSKKSLDNLPDSPLTHAMARGDTKASRLRYLGYLSAEL